MRWTKQTPKITGWWLVGLWKGKNWITNLIEVREYRRKMEWSFIDGLTWNPVDGYPKYWWAGPINTPKLPKKCK